MRQKRRRDSFYKSERARERERKKERSVGMRLVERESGPPSLLTFVGSLAQWLKARSARAVGVAARSLAQRHAIDSAFGNKDFSRKWCTYAMRNTYSGQTLTAHFLNCAAVLHWLDCSPELVSIFENNGALWLIRFLPWIFIFVIIIYLFRKIMGYLGIFCKKSSIMWHLIIQNCQLNSPFE